MPDALCDHCGNHVDFETYLQHAGLEQVETKTLSRTSSNPITNDRTSHDRILSCEAKQFVPGPSNPSNLSRLHLALAGEQQIAAALLQEHHAAVCPYGADCPIAKMDQQQPDTRTPLPNSEGDYKRGRFAPSEREILTRSDQDMRALLRDTGAKVAKYGGGI